MRTDRAFEHRLLKPVPVTMKQTEAVLKRIIKDIKENNFSNFYLLYGNDAFLKNQYRDKLREALLPESDDINLNSFEGKDIDCNEVSSIAATLPFFAERRLIIIKNSGWFKSMSAFFESVSEIPETTFFIFVEDDVDKRNKLYKFVSDKGYAAEINSPDPKELLTMVAAALRKKNLLISKSECEYFISKVGTDMSRVQSELDKITAYCLGKGSVEKEDIDSICSEIPESRIFLMIDAMMNGNESRALELYYQMLAAHEKPMSVLFLLNKNYNQLYQALLLKEKGYGRKSIADALSIRDFVAEKYMRMSGHYRLEDVKKIVDYGISLEEKIKQGNMDERIAVEIFIVKFSSM